jgi:ATP-binding cassette subfamily B multidrug efflux pump
MKAFRELVRYMAPYWLVAVLAPLTMALEVAMDLSQPRLMQRIVDEGIAKGNLPLIHSTGLLMIGAALVGVIGGVGCTFFATIAAQRFATDLRADLFRRVQGLSFGNLDRLETGRLITRLTNDVDQMQEAAAMVLRILVRAPLLVIGSLIMAVVTCPSLSPILVAISPLLILVFVGIIRPAHVLFAAMQERLDRVNVIMLENLSGVRLVKAFVRATYEIGRFGKANDEYMVDTTRASSLVAGVMPSMMLLVNLGVVAVIWFGGVQVQEGRVQVGQILAFINYLTQMLGSMMMVGMLMMRIARADASAERILQVVHMEPEVQDDAQAVSIERSRGEVRFEDVDFSYDGEMADPVLRGISFVAKPGETVAILGSTGSGKSTLVNLIPRLYDVKGGRVLIDGIDIRKMRQEELREQIGMVPQETVLFSGTIRDNLRYGRPEASDAEVEEVARLAHAHEFISSFPEGYDTVLGQRGVNLSGGQKQRLAIARALACRPPILIMDDCTSAVDASTEAEIIEALETWPDCGTRIVVAQRIGSVIGADRILVLDDGKVVADGTHSELVETCPIYQEIVRSQLGEEGVTARG